jgi:hypothetical protein
MYSAGKHAAILRVKSRVSRSFLLGTTELRVENNIYFRLTMSTITLFSELCLHDLKYKAVV